MVNSRSAFRHVLASCLLIYVFSAKGYLEVSDTAYSLQTAQAIVNRDQLNIPYAEGGTLRAPDGRSYSKYGFGLPLYYVPFVAVSNALSHSARLPASVLVGFLISFANIPFALLTLVLFSRLLQLFEVTGVYLWLLPLTLGLGTLTWRYAGYDFSEEMQMTFLLLSVYGVIRGTPKAILFAGAGFAALFLVKLVYVAFFPLFVGYLFTRHGILRQRIRRVAMFILPFVLVGGFIALMNFIRFGNPMESGYGSEARQFLPSQLSYTVPRLLGSLDKGLFIFCPVLIFGLFGWRKFFSKYRPEAVLFGGLLMGNVILSGSWHSWMGGWSWGPRLLVPVIPLWFLPAAFWLERQTDHARLWAFLSLSLFSAVVQIPGILVKDQEVHTIKDNILTAEEQRSAPSDYVTACILLMHKLTLRNEVYRVSDFHIPGDREIDLTRYRTFLGLNVWTEQVARQLNKPLLRWLPLPAFFLVAYLAMQSAAMLKTAVSPETQAKQQCSVKS